MMFSRKNDVAHGCVCTADGEIIMRSEKGDTRIMNASDILLPGTHNVENYLAAISAVWGSVSIETIRTVAQNFAGVEHRMELVRTLRGARYYNDSIATTPTRTIAGLNAWGSGVILIAGGYDKNIPFDALGPKIVDKVKLLILLGNTADKIEASVKAARGYREGRPEIIRVASLEEAVDTAAKAAAAGDIVTLSPACASFDMFGSYEERGEIFRELVNALK
jgi:UDP-N-acetylmuramoylalanine--D-glutamate ligase